MHLQAGPCSLHCHGWELEALYKETSSSDGSLHSLLASLHHSPVLFKQSHAGRCQQPSTVRMSGNLSLMAAWMPMPIGAGPW